MFDNDQPQDSFTPSTGTPIDPDPGAYLRGPSADASGVPLDPGEPGGTLLTPSIDELDAIECLELLRYTEREQARRDALKIRIMARLAALRDASPGQPVTPTVADNEVAAELGQSQTSVTKRMAEAVALVSRLPTVVAALENGEIDLARAQALVDLTKALPAGQSAEAAALTLRKGRRSSPVAFRRAARRIVDALDVEGAQRRRKRVRPTWDVQISTRASHGFARLSSTLPAADAVRAYKHIDHLARQGLALDDLGSLPRRRVEILLDLVLDRRSSRTQTSSARTAQSTSTPSRSHLSDPAERTVEQPGPARATAVPETDPNQGVRAASRIWRRRARSTARGPLAGVR